ncbi:MAG TPA: TonB-dependent receptor, partial [Dokdonella sp.]
NTLFNLGRVETRGYDFGVNWLGNETGIGTFGASLQTTYLDHYRAVATDSGQAEPRGVGVEVADSGMPKWRTTARANWNAGDWSVGWTTRFLSELTEGCGAAEGYPICDGPDNTHHLGGTTYHDLRASWTAPTELKLTIAGGINNVFGKEPPVCLSCSLNGYDASVYDLPGRFSYIEASIRF